MANLLVAYGSKHGQTAKIAEAFEKELSRLGHSVTLRNVQVPVHEELDEYDGVLVAAPVYAGKYPKFVQEWVKERSTGLSQTPSAFVSVCLGVLEKNPASQEQERKIVQSFLGASAWTPSMMKIVAGALAYRQYNWLIRLMMKRIARKAGGDTDTKRNHEYTNWEEIRKFAEAFSQMIQGKQVASL